MKENKKIICRWIILSTMGIALLISMVTEIEQLS